MTSHRAAAARVLSDVPATSPDDELNRQLVTNVHPLGWRNPTPEGRYNLVVIGAGTAGLVAAAGAAGMGAKVALVERGLMGGDCLNVGCVPSKTIISAARAAAAVRRAGDLGVRANEQLAVDFGSVMERVRRVRAEISPHDSAERFKSLGVDVYFGSAAFVDTETIEVAGQRLKFKRAVIATGARATAPSIPGLDEVDYLTNETLFSLTQLPERFGVIGGGPIGCEMAQAFAQLGSQVSLFETSARVLSKEEEDASQVLQKSIVASGVRVCCNVKELRVSMMSSGIGLRYLSEGRSHEDEVDQLLVAAGRTPNIEGLGLDVVGVDYDKHGVHVDDFLRTTNARIYAAGDICSRYKFTHAADFMARLVVQNALFMGRKRRSKLIIPWCTYTTPEVAHVGLYPHEAEEQGIEIDTYSQAMSTVDRAVLEGEEQGFVRVHVKKGSDKILGATIVAANAGDMISQLTMAMNAGVGLGKIANTIFPYPTQAEAIRKLGDQYNRTRLTPLVKKLSTGWLSWRR